MQCGNITLRQEIKSDSVLLFGLSGFFSRASVSSLNLNTFSGWLGGWRLGV